MAFEEIDFTSREPVMAVDPAAPAAPEATPATQDPFANIDFSSATPAATANPFEGIDFSSQAQETPFANVDFTSTEVAPLPESPGDLETQAAVEQPLVQLAAPDSPTRQFLNYLRASVSDETSINNLEKQARDEGFYERVAPAISEARKINSTQKQLAASNWENVKAPLRLMGAALGGIFPIVKLAGEVASSEAVSDLGKEWQKGKVNPNLGLLYDKAPIGKMGSAPITPKRGVSWEAALEQAKKFEDVTPEQEAYIQKTIEGERQVAGKELYDWAKKGLAYEGLTDRQADEAILYYHKNNPAKLLEIARKESQIDREKAARVWQAMERGDIGSLLDEAATTDYYQAVREANIPVLSSFIGKLGESSAGIVTSAAEWNKLLSGDARAAELQDTLDAIKIGQAELASVTPYRADTLDKVKGAMDFVEYAAGALGNLAPSMLLTIAGGGLLQKALGLVNAARFGTAYSAAKGAGDAAKMTEIIEAAKAANKKAAYAGAFLPSYFMEVGAISGEGGSRLESLIGAAPAAALDSLIPGDIVNRSSVAATRKSFFEKAVDISKMAIKDALGEGLTEGAQTIVEKYAAEFSDQYAPLLREDNVKEFMEAAVQGAIGGAGISLTMGNMGQEQAPATQQAAVQTMRNEAAKRLTQPLRDAGADQTADAVEEAISATPPPLSEALQKAQEIQKQKEAPAPVAEPEAIPTAVEPTPTPTPEVPSAPTKVQQQEGVSVQPQEGAPSGQAPQTGTGDSVPPAASPAPQGAVTPTVVPPKTEIPVTPPATPTELSAFDAAVAAKDFEKANEEFMKLVGDPTAPVARLEELRGRLSALAQEVKAEGPVGEERPQWIKDREILRKKGVQVVKGKVTQKGLEVLKRGPRETTQEFIANGANELDGKPLAKAPIEDTPEFTEATGAKRVEVGKILENQYREDEVDSGQKGRIVDGAYTMALRDLRSGKIATVEEFNNAMAGHANRLGQQFFRFNKMLAENAPAAAPVPIEGAVEKPGVTAPQGEREVPPKQQSAQDFEDSLPVGKGGSPNQKLAFRMREKLDRGETPTPDETAAVEEEIQRLSAAIEKEGKPPEQARQEAQDRFQKRGTALLEKQKSDDAKRAAAQAEAEVSARQQAAGIRLKSILDSFGNALGERIRAALTSLQSYLPTATSTASKSDQDLAAIRESVLLAFGANPSIEEIALLDRLIDALKQSGPEAFDRIAQELDDLGETRRQEVADAEKFLTTLTSDEDRLGFLLAWTSAYGYYPSELWQLMKDLERSLGISRFENGQQIFDEQKEKDVYEKGTRIYQNFGPGGLNISSGGAVSGVAEAEPVPADAGRERTDRATIPREDVGRSANWADRVTKVVAASIDKAFNWAKYRAAYTALWPSTQAANYLLRMNGLNWRVIPTNQPALRGVSFEGFAIVEVDPKTGDYKVNSNGSINGAPLIDLLTDPNITDTVPEAVKRIVYSRMKDTYFRIQSHWQEHLKDTTTAMAAPNLFVRLLENLKDQMTFTSFLQSDPSNPYEVVNDSFHLPGQTNVLGWVDTHVSEIPDPVTGKTRRVLVITEAQLGKGIWERNSKDGVDPRLQEIARHYGLDPSKATFERDAYRKLLEPVLTYAKENGLQVALPNGASALKIQGHVATSKDGKNIQKLYEEKMLGFLKDTFGEVAENDVTLGQFEPDERDSTKVGPFVGRIFSLNQSKPQAPSLNLGAYKQRSEDTLTEKERPLVDAVKRAFAQHFGGTPAKLMVVEGGKPGSALFYVPVVDPATGKVIGDVVAIHAELLARYTSRDSRAGALEKIDSAMAEERFHSVAVKKLSPEDIAAIYSEITSPDSESSIPAMQFLIQRVLGAKARPDNLTQAERNRLSEYLKNTSRYEVAHEFVRWLASKTRGRSTEEVMADTHASMGLARRVVSYVKELIDMARTVVNAKRSSPASLRLAKEILRRLEEPATEGPGFFDEEGPLYSSWDQKLGKFDIRGKSVYSKGDDYYTPAERADRDYRIKNDLLVTERLPRDVQEGIRGTPLEAAIKVAERDVRERAENEPEWAGKVTPDNARTIAYQVANVYGDSQQNALAAAAVGSGTDQRFGPIADAWLNSPLQIAGQEHIAIPSARGVWTKILYDSPLHKDMLSYLQRLAIFNTIFPGTAVTFKGFTIADRDVVSPKDIEDGPKAGEKIIEKGDLLPIVEQGHIDSLRKAEYDEVKADMLQRGFQPLGTSTSHFIDPDTGIIVWDLHGGNAKVVGYRADGTPIIQYLDAGIEFEPATKFFRLQREMRERVTATPATSAANLPEGTAVVGQELYSSWVTPEQDAAYAREVRDVADYLKGGLKEARSTGDWESYENVAANAHERLTKAGMPSDVATQLLGDVQGGLPEDIAVTDALAASAQKSARHVPTPEQDAAYLDAVKRGDLETAHDLFLRAAVENAFAGMPKEIVDLAYKYEKAKRKISYRDNYVTQRSYTENPAQQAAASRAYTKLHRAYGEAFPKDEMSLGLIKAQQSLRLDDFRKNLYSNKDIEFHMDDQGNVIPLSQRFNPESPSILHSAWTDPMSYTPNRSVYSRLKKWIRDNLTSDGKFFKFKDVLWEIAKTEGEIRAISKDAYEKLDAFNRELGKVLKKSTAYGLTNEQLGEELRSLVSIAMRDPENEAAWNFLTEAEPALGKAVSDMRQSIDELSSRLSATGLVSNRLMDIIEKRLTKYVTRSYQIHDDPDYGRAIRRILSGEVYLDSPEDARLMKVISRASEFFEKELAYKRAKTNLYRLAKAAPAGSPLAALQAHFGNWNQFKGDPAYAQEVSKLANAILSGAVPSLAVTPADVDAAILESIDAQDGGGTDAFFAPKATNVKAARDILKNRSVIPEEIRELWGEYSDPGVNFVKTSLKLANLTTKSELLSQLSTMLSDKLLFNTAADALKAGVSAPVQVFPESEQYGPMAGTWGPEELRDAFNEYSQAPAVEPMLKVFTAAIGYVLGAKTALSITSGIRNFVGNLVPAASNGYLGYLFKKGVAGKAFGASDNPLLNKILKDKAAFSELYKKLLKLGVVDEGVEMGLMMEMIADVNRQSVRSTKTEDVLRYLMDKSSRITDLAGRLYQSYDNFWKVVAYTAEYDRYSRALPEKEGQSAESREKEVSDYAARVVRDVTFTYSKIPKVLSKVRKNVVGVFFAPFVAFNAEVIRTHKNILATGIKDLKEGMSKGNSELAYVGANRLTSLALTHAAMMAAGKLISAALGGDDDDDQLFMRKFLPDWSQASPLIMLDKDKKEGKFSYIDVGFTNPWSYFYQPYLYAKYQSDQSPVSLAFRSLSQLIAPFTKEQILTSALMDVARGDKVGIYNTEDDDVTKITKSLKHLAKTLEPGTLTTIRNLYDAFTGTENKWGRVREPGTELLSAFSGFRVNSVDVDQALEVYSRKFARSTSSGTRILNDALRPHGELDKDEIRKAFNRSQEVRVRAMQELRDTMKAAEYFGLPRGKVVAMMRANGVSGDTIQYALSGFVPKNKLSEVTEQRLMATENGRKKYKAYLEEYRKAPAGTRLK